MSENPMDVCEMCRTNPLPNGRYFSQQKYGLRVCSNCYYFGTDDSCETVGRVLEGLRAEILFYERTAPQLYGDWIAKKRAAEREKDQAEREARWQKFWPGKMREA